MAPACLSLCGARCLKTLPVASRGLAGGPAHVPTGSGMQRREPRTDMTRPGPSLAPCRLHGLGCRPHTWFNAARWLAGFARERPRPAQACGSLTHVPGLWPCPALQSLLRAQCEPQT